MIKLADVGLSTGIGGSVVARSVSDGILIDDNFASLVKAIQICRTILVNIRRIY